MLDEELDRRIRTALHDVPADPAPPGGLEAVTERGRQLRRRRLIPTGAVAVLLVVAASSLVLEARSTSNDVVTAAGDDNRQTAEEGGAGVSTTPPSIVDHISGPLADLPLSDDPLQLLSNVMVRGDGVELIVTSSTDPGKELSIKRPSGGGMAFTPRRPMAWSVSGSVESALNTRVALVIGVTRQEIARVEYSSARETASANTIRSEEFPSLRFFAIELAGRHDFYEVGEALPVVVGYDDAGHEMIRWERPLPTSAPTSVIDD